MIGWWKTQDNTHGLNSQLSPRDYKNNVISSKTTAGPSFEDEMNHLGDVFPDRMIKKKKSVCVSGRSCCVDDLPRRFYANTPLVSSSSSSFSAG